MKIKICGLKRTEDIEYINQVKIDFAGFIFAQNSKRRVDLKTAETMKRLLNPDIKSVGVFANQDLNFIKEISEKKIIDIIQLHGSEDNDFICKIKEMTNLEVIKAFKADNNLEYAINISAADYVLIDSYNEKSFGGTGSAFDWSLIPQTDKKIFLAGGINILNAEKALKDVKPYCIDINSGVETNGVKDKYKIIEIVDRIRNKK